MREILEGVFKFPHLLIRGLIKGLSTNQAFVSSTSSIKIYHYVGYNGSTSKGIFLERIFKVLHLLIRGIVKGLGLT